GGGAGGALRGRAGARAVSARRDGYVANWNDEETAGSLKTIGAELIRGHGRLDGPRRVAVRDPGGNTVTMTARHAVVVCTGSRPDLPELAGLGQGRPGTNRQGTHSRPVPGRLALVRGGG